MRVGLSVSSSLVATSPAESARWMIERAAAADRVALDSLTVGDHHAMATPYQQNTPILGRLLAEWHGRPAGCLFLLPLWPPVLAAEHISTLAALVDAPFVVQTGIGAGEHQFAAMGADHPRRGRVLEERVVAVKALLAGDPVEDLLGVPLTLGLRPERPVEWWIGGGPHPAAIRRAARLGDAWYASPALGATDAPEQLELYLDACAEMGVAARPILRRDAVVLAAPGAAEAAATPILEQGYRGLRRDHVLVGTPAEVAEQLGPFVELGFTDVICRSMTVPQVQAIETIELLAEVRDLLR